MPPLSRAAVPFFRFSFLTMRSSVRPTLPPPASTSSWNHCAELDAQLRERGSQLVVRRGKPADELMRLLDESSADGIFFNRDYEPYALERDAAVEQAIQAHGRRVATFADHLLAEPEVLLTADGKPPTVYTPYRRRWLARLEADPTLTAKRAMAAISTLRLWKLSEGTACPPPQSSGFEVKQTMMPAGSARPQALLKDFVHAPAPAYGPTTTTESTRRRRNLAPEHPLPPGHTRHPHCSPRRTRAPPATGRCRRAQSGRDLAGRVGMARLLYRHHGAFSAGA